MKFYLPRVLQWPDCWSIKLENFPFCVSFNRNSMHKSEIIHDSSILFEIVFILVGTGFCGISCMITTIPILQIGFYIVMLTCSVCANIVNAAAVEIYPTALRWEFDWASNFSLSTPQLIFKYFSRAMAVSIIMLFGRLGSAFGTNIIAYLLDSHCQYAFYMSGISLIGKIELNISLNMIPIKCNAF